MGNKVPNIELVNDYTTQEGCVRLHIDLPLTKDEMIRFRRMMEAEDIQAAFDIVRDSTTEDNQDLVNSFQEGFARIFRKRLKAA